MAFSAGTTLSAAALSAALGLTTKTTFTTTAPAGAGWYRLTAGGMIAFHWVSTGTVNATTNVTPDFTLPTGYRPATLTAIAAAAGTSGTRLAACAIAPDGTWVVYSGHSAAAIISAHGVYDPA